MNYYPFHIGDFRSGTVNMTRQARWIYRDMLDVYYDSEKPLTLDFDGLCDSIGVDSEEERKIVERLLRFKFTRGDDGYQQEICDKVIAEYHGKAETARSNGKLGGRPKKATGGAIEANIKPSGFQSGSNVDATCNQSESQSEANQEPITINQEPATKDIHVADAPSVSVAVDQVFEFWKTAMDSPRSLLDDKRKKTIKAALKTGYTAEQLCSAITGCAKSDYHMGKNEAGTKYNGLDLILRNAEKIDKFIVIGTSTLVPQRPRNAQASRHTGFDDIDYSKGFE